MDHMDNSDGQWPVRPWLGNEIGPSFLSEVRQISLDLGHVNNS